MRIDGSARLVGITALTALAALGCAEDGDGKGDTSSTGAPYVEPPEPSVDFNEGTPATKNDEDLVQRCVPALAEAVGDSHLQPADRTMGAEDFSFYGLAGVPIFIARAGGDQFAGVNPSIDAFAAEALRLNLPLTLVNHAAGAHGFDLFDDSEASRGVIRMLLEFLRTNLGARTS